MAMKTALRISMAVNVVMLAGLMFVFSRQSQTKEQPAATPTSTLKAETQVAAAAGLPPAGRIPPHTAPASFHWNQLEAADYHVFVKNLRAIGCPEETVRAIVSDDVHTVFLIRTRELEKELSDLNSGSWASQLTNYNSVAAARDELGTMPDREAAEINDLLGLKSAPVQLAAETGTPAQSPNLNYAGQPEPVSPPLVFENVNLPSLNLSENQMQAITNIQRDFLQQIGGTNQDPGDPAYLARWQKAQPAADMQLQEQLGMQAYLDYQIKANEKRLERQYAQTPE